MYEKLINNVWFETFIYQDLLQNKIKDIASSLKNKFVDKKPVFVPVLNGSVPFVVDLMKYYENDCYVNYVYSHKFKNFFDEDKVSVYIDNKSIIKQQDIILVTGFTETGQTLEVTEKYIKDFANPTSITIVSLFSREDYLKYPILPDYTGFELKDEFVVGYGLGFYGLGRNLTNIYKATDKTRDKICYL